MKVLQSISGIREINETLADRDWYNEFAFLEVNECYLIFKHILISLVEKHIPVSNCGASVPWRVHPLQALKYRSD